mgnify:CR=1 FL=1
MSKFVTFSFDDGIEQDKRFVEMLNKYGFKATFNINTGIQTRANSWVNEGVEIHRMNIKGLKELYKGHEVAVHTLTHPFLEKLDEETVYNEIYYDKKNIEDWFDGDVVGMAYPYGTYDDRVIKIARELGIKYARTAGTSMKFSVPENLMKYSGTCHFSNSEIFRLIDDFEALPDDSDSDENGRNGAENRKDDERQILYIWGHTYEFDVLKKWDFLTELFERLKTVRANFVTNREAFGL